MGVVVKGRVAIAGTEPRPSDFHVGLLRDAGCRDAAALAAAPWAPSVGHFDHADMGYRCIDTHRVSPSLTPAVIGWEVIDTEAARAASDHLPVVTTLDLSHLPGNG